jgi:subtilisin family serine protease
MVTVAVIDSGVDLGHPDLVGNLIEGYDFVREDPIPDDENGHGTHVAGILGATAGESLTEIGVAGVSWRVSIMPLKAITWAGDIPLINAIAAIQHACAHRVDIINASWGFDSESALLRDAVEDAGALGILFVEAAGNEGKEPCATGAKELFPACWPLNNVIVVANSTGTDHLHVTSNWGDSIDLAAPGTSIYSTTIGSGYGLDTGTSFATPQVSGVAALVKALRPNLNALEIQGHLISGVDWVPALSGLVESDGRLNASATLQDLLPRPSTVYVDGGYWGLEDGTAFHPFVRFAEGAVAVAEGGQLVIQNGTYAEGGLTIEKAMTISAQGGVVRIE